MAILSLFLKTLTTSKEISLRTLGQSQDLSIRLDLSKASRDTSSSRGSPPINTGSRGLPTNPISQILSSSKTKGDLLISNSKTTKGTNQPTSSHSWLKRRNRKGRARNLEKRSCSTPSEEARSPPPTCFLKRTTIHLLQQLPSTLTSKYKSSNNRLWGRSNNRKPKDPTNGPPTSQIPTASLARRMSPIIISRWMFFLPHLCRLTKLRCLINRGIILMEPCLSSPTTTLLTPTTNSIKYDNNPLQPQLIKFHSTKWMKGIIRTPRNQFKTNMLLSRFLSPMSSSTTKTAWSSSSPDNRGLRCRISKTDNNQTDRATPQK